MYSLQFYRFVQWFVTGGCPVYILEVKIFLKVDQNMWGLWQIVRKILYISQIASVSSATIITVSYQNTNNVHIVARNV
jgi:hypothetical protein